MMFDPKAARQLLDFYAEAGVDALLGETPIDRFAAAESGPAVRPTSSVLANESIRHNGFQESNATNAGTDQSAPASRESSLKTVGNPSSIVPPDTAAMQAREASKTAATLDELRAILERFEGCTLKATATQLVFGDGNPKAKLMLIGEAPGREEDLEGRPFVGRSGKLLDRMLAAIGLDRHAVYIANIVPWRPPGNRTPTPQESQICLPFIQRQVKLVDPDILVCLGSPSAQTLLGIKDGIIKTRGRWFTYNTGKRDIRAMPTFHPAFLLRSPIQKRLAWRDFLAIKKELAH
jgi:DNA polymerase